MRTSIQPSIRAWGIVPQTHIMMQYQAILCKEMVCYGGSIQERRYKVEIQGFPVLAQRRCRTRRVRKMHRHKQHVRRQRHGCPPMPSSSRSTLCTLRCHPLRQLSQQPQVNPQRRSILGRWYDWKVCCMVFLSSRPTYETHHAYRYHGWYHGSNYRNCAMGHIRCVSCSPCRDR